MSALKHYGGFSKYNKQHRVQLQHSKSSGPVLVLLTARKQGQANELRKPDEEGSLRKVLRGRGKVGWHLDEQEIDNILLSWFSRTDLIFWRVLGVNPKGF